MIEYINIELKHSILLLKKFNSIWKRREGENMFISYENKQIIFDVYFRASSTQGNEILFQGLGRFEN